MSGIMLENVVKRFGEQTIIPELNLSIAEGEFVVIVGPSGCGKSTTLRMIAGLEDVTSGTIYIGGRDVTWVPPKSRDIAMVFQSYALYPHMNVAANMSFALRLSRTPEGRNKGTRAQGGRNARADRVSGTEAKGPVRRTTPTCGNGALDRP